MYINQVTGMLYVGSSTNMFDRLKHYFKSHTGNVRLILKDIREYEIQNFKLRVYLIPEHLQSPRLLLALEQYYILSLNPANNTLMVVNGSPGGMRISAQNSITNGTPIAVFMDSQLIYVFHSLNGLSNDAVTGLRASTTTLLACLDLNSLFLNTFTLVRITNEIALTNYNSSYLISSEELTQLVLDTREQYKRH
jgi:hypothetical protein